MPRGDAFWDKPPIDGILKPEARHDLRRGIDEEKSRRSDVAASWWKTIILPAMTVLIGIIGALTGLLAQLRK